jgi:hypothetical protein
MGKNRSKSRSRVSRVTRITIRIGLAVVLAGLVSLRPAHKAEARANGGGVVCITDTRTRDNIQFTNPGGAYTFTQCSTGFTVSGTGTVSTKSGVITLTDKKSDRSVNAGLNPNQKTGTMVIYFTQTPGAGAQVFRVNQTDPNQTCGCVVGCK